MAKEWSSTVGQSDAFGLFHIPWSWTNQNPNDWVMIFPFTLRNNLRYAPHFHPRLLPRNVGYLSFFTLVKSTQITISLVFPWLSHDLHIFQGFSEVFSSGFPNRKLWLFVRLNWGPPTSACELGYLFSTCSWTDFWSLKSQKNGRISRENHRKTNRKTIGKWWFSMGFDEIYPPVSSATWLAGSHGP